MVVVCGVAGDAVGGGRLLSWLTGEAGCKCSIVVRDISYVSAPPFSLISSAGNPPFWNNYSVLNVKCILGVPPNIPSKPYPLLG